MHHTAAILEWKASASSRRAFVIPKEPNWPLANAGSAAEVTSPLLVIGDEHPLVLGLRVLNLTVAAVEIRRSTRLPGPDVCLRVGGMKRHRRAPVHAHTHPHTHMWGIPSTPTICHCRAFFRSLSKGPFSLQPTETGKLYCTLQAIVLRPSESAAHESPSMLSGNCKPGRTCRPAR
ncbi:hypothetical protein MCOR23_004103 [Pyricularia oryzae]|nr:hypothetical protein MCOR23_004103 [Pyricularia oryzae]